MYLTDGNDNKTLNETPSETCVLERLLFEEILALFIGKEIRFYGFSAENRVDCQSFFGKLRTSQFAIHCRHLEYSLHFENQLKTTTFNCYFLPYESINSALGSHICGLLFRSLIPFG